MNNNDSNYFRWLIVFSTEMLNLSKKHVNHVTNIFAQSATGNPYSNLPPDLRVECAMNNNVSEFKSSWKYLLRNESTLLVQAKDYNKINAVGNYINDSNGESIRKLVTKKIHALTFDKR